MRTTVVFGVAALAAGLLWLTQVAGQTTTKTTVITIEDLDCPSCAKAVEKALAKVPGVESVKTDVKTQTATVTPKGDSKLSAKALWEAVEGADFKVTKIEGPGGTYTAKPNS